MRAPRLRSVATQLGVQYLDTPLRRGSRPGLWLSPQDGSNVAVEEAVLARFRMEGWRGYAGEGGLILNLIKAMSFETIAPRNRSTYIEALYAQNVAFDEDHYAPEDLLATLHVADKRRVSENFEVMASRNTITVQYGGFSGTSSASMLDYFPGLERWMFIELLEVAGNELMYSIASKFREAPYEFRRGWPDITMWRGRELRFVEVKAPGDRVKASQERIISEFARPLGLSFWLAGVRDIER